MINYDPALIVPDFQILTQTVILTSVSSTQIVRANPSRVLISFDNPNVASPMWVNIVPTPNGGVGFVVSGQGNQPLSFPFATWGPLCGQPWFGIGTAGSPTIFVVEIIYRPRGA